LNVSNTTVTPSCELRRLQIADGRSKSQRDRRSIAILRSHQNIYCNGLQCYVQRVYSTGSSWWHSMVVITSVLAGELSLSCARLMDGRLTSLTSYQSTNKANSACHPSGVG